MNLKILEITLILSNWKWKRNQSLAYVRGGSVSLFGFGLYDLNLSGYIWINIVRHGSVRQKIIAKATQVYIFLA